MDTAIRPDGVWMVTGCSTGFGGSSTFFSSTNTTELTEMLTSTTFSPVIVSIAFLTAVLSYLMGLSDGPEALRMLGAAFLFWSVPHIGNALISIVAAGRAYAEHLFLK